MEVLAVGFFVLSLLLILILMELKKLNSSFLSFKSTFRIVAEIIERRKEHLDKMEYNSDEIRDMLQSTLDEMKSISSVSSIYYEQKLSDEHHRKIFNRD